MSASPAPVPPAPSSPAPSSPLPTSPLMERHLAGHAETIDYGGIETVHTFGAPQAEYAAIRKACGLMDRSFRAVLEVGGRDRCSFLNNFLTNLVWNKDTKTGLAAGTGTYAFLLNAKGRIVADMNVLETGDSVLLETDARLIPVIRPALEKFVFTEKVTFTDRSGQWTELGLYGPAAVHVLQEAGAVVGELPELGVRRIGLGGQGEGPAGRAGGAWVFRDDVCGVPGLHLLVERSDALAVWDLLTAPYANQTHKRTLRPVGWAMFNACRIEAGRPLYGIDFTDQSLPAETGLFERAVSVTKGCYLGQEIVARMYARGQVARQVVGVRMLADALPTAGADVTDADGNVIGAVTSSTLSPVLGGAAIALATVKRGFTNPGTRLRIPAEGAVHDATVTQLPFLR